MSNTIGSLCHFQKWNIRHRLAVGHTLAIFAMLVIYSFVLYGIFRSSVVEQIDLKLRNDLEWMDDSLGKALNAPQSFAVADPENWLTEIWNNQGTRVFSSGAAEDYPMGNLQMGCVSLQKPFSEKSNAGFDVRIFCQESALKKGLYVIRVGRILPQSHGSLELFLSAALFGIPIMVLISTWVGYYLAGRALNPIKNLGRAASLICANRLSERLPVLNPNDEIGALAKTFNDVFANLENSFKQMMRFTADASHELRTPLTAIRALGEVALSADHNSISHVDSLANILEETERLQSLCDSLLLLSRADSGQVVLNFKRLNVADLVKECLDFLSVLADEKQQLMLFHSAAPAWADVDKSLFKNVVINVLFNAIKFSPPETKIDVRCWCDAACFFVTVSDEGIGIPEDLHEKIFQRFYRVDGSRSRQSGVTGGAGLGLSISQWAAQMHGGEIRVSKSSSQGSIFEIKIPRSQINV
jgi:heavy metal sensor kinase